MHRCSCSTRALEILVKDFAGLDILLLRRHRAQYFFQHSRPISTRPPVRQIEATIRPHLDDGFVPFELGGTGVQSSVGSAELIKDTEFPPYKEISGEDGAAQWHAEVEISDLGMLAGAGTRLESDTIDAIRLPDMHLEAASGSSAPVLHLPAISQHLFHGNPQTPPNTKLFPLVKTASRKLRKARRIEAGTYRPAAESKMTVLNKIGMIEGALMAEEGKESGIEEAKVKAVAEEEAIGTKKGKVIRSAKSATKTTRTTKTKEGNAGSAKLVAPLRSTIKSKTVKKEPWQVQKAALERKFAERGWQPRKRLSPDTLEGIRALHASDPASYSTATLAEHFQITPEAIRRVLRSKWRPKPEEIEDRMKRWESRGLRKWEEMSASGVKPPKRWREMGVENPVLKNKIYSNMEGHSDEATWKRAEELGDRLPFEGSFAERLLY
ncbi:hypothetical protein DOTSEDRAFT_68332 [Dothistroma septosporum NZE10]|uniref:Required for respiratory growth protein 9, mitochondrial n=1 Tax=Dothistroma septosporum (strain NZE10 / CBS 128990) TaxID=675120 RepID=N1Q1G3_DOTSN|nr:hypothetical protein DOTSEDRAFT_68332 [Dothistroma septosporum NZE10]